MILNNKKAVLKNITFTLFCLLLKIQILGTNLHEVNNNIYFNSGIQNRKSIDVKQMNTAIQGIIWTDTNGNGIKNVEEPGIPEKEVELLDVFGNPISSTFTDFDGLYSFTNLLPGEYVVHFVSIQNMFLTEPNVNGGPDQSNDTEDDSDADLDTGNSFVINLDENQLVDHVDAGYFQTGTIRGLVWNDSIVDGKRQVSEKRQAGWVIEVLTEDDSTVIDVHGNIVSAITTNSLGAYQFQGLVPGVYQIKWGSWNNCFYTISNYSGKINDIGDAQDDSDVFGTFSHKINLTSDRSVQGVDLGIRKFLSIQGNVFYDLFKNGVFSKNLGVNESCLIELWKINGDAPCPGSSKTLIQTVSTMYDGSYNFLNLPSGNYIVKVADSNFEPGSPLYNLTASTPTEYCMNLDCESSQIDYHFGFISDCDKSTGWQQWPNCEIASMQPVICNLMIYDGSCGLMLHETSPEPVPMPLCPGGGGGGAHNMSWFSFIAGFGQYEILINPKNCSLGIAGLKGIQTGIYKDCTFDNIIFCEPLCISEYITIPCNTLIPGEKYYLFLDGCAGSFCEYGIEISGNYSPYQFPDSSVLRLHTLQDTFCPNEIITFSLTGLNINADYTWSVKDSAGNNPDLVYPSGWPKTNANEVVLSFPKPGHYTVCMENVSNSCDNSGPYCKTVVIQNKYKLDFLAKDTILKSGDSITTFISLPNDTSSTIFVVPLQNNLVKNMKKDTLYNGRGFVNQHLFNKTEVSQIARYLLYPDSIHFPECTNPDTLSITVLPEMAIYENQVRFCADSCTTLSAMLPDSTTTWLSFLWNTGDNTRQITACYDTDSLMYVFVQDTNNLYYKLQFRLIPELTRIEFDVARQPECQDSMLELVYQAYSENLPDENFRYFIFDCSQFPQELLLSMDTFGKASIPMTVSVDTFCLRLDVFSDLCQYSSFLYVPNPNYIIGKPCDDNDPNTINDVYDEDCICKGEFDNSVSLTDKSGTIKVYPNPASDYIDVVFDKEENDVEIFLISSVGQPLLFESFDILNGKRISVRNLPVAMYFLKIKHQNKYFYIKVLKV